MSETILYVIIFAAVAVIGYSLFAKTPGTPKAGGAPGWYELVAPFVELFSKGIGDFLEKHLELWSSRLNRWCGEAGGFWRAADIYGMQQALFFCMICLGLLLGSFFGKTFIFLIPMLVVLTLAALAFPVFYVHQMATKRMYEISKVMPFAIDLISSAMNAGLDFLGAVRYYTSLNFTDSLSREFLFLLREIELGKSRTDALRNMEGRVHSDDFSRFVASVIYSLESGAGIIEVMELQADEVRRLRFAKIEEQIAKVPSKMLVPIVLFTVPGIFIVVIAPLAMRMMHNPIFSSLFN